MVQNLVKARIIGDEYEFLVSALKNSWANKRLNQNPLIEINIANMKSKLPKIVNAFLTNAGSSVLDFIFSPRFDQTNMAKIPPLVVMADLVKIPIIPPPKSSKNFVIISDGVSSVLLNALSQEKGFIYALHRRFIDGSPQ